MTMTVARPLERTRHGRYEPLTEEGCGDLLLSLRAASFWNRLGFEPASVDAVSAVDVWERDAQLSVRVVCRDFFTGLRLICELDPETGRPF